MRSKVPKLRRHKGSGQGVVTLSGKDCYCGPWPAGMKLPPPEVEERYRRHVAEWLSTGFDGIRETHPVPTPAIRAQIQMLTVEALSAKFWLFAERKFTGPDGKPTAELSSVRVTLRVLCRLYRSIPVSEFGPLKMRAVRQEFITEGMARVNVNHHIGRLKRIFKWGVQEEIVPPSVLVGLSAVAGLRRGGGECREGRTVKPVADEKVDATLPHLPPPVVQMVQFLRFTGARVGEACGMRSCDIDRTGPVWIFRPVHHKTHNRGHLRAIAIGPKGQTILAPLLADLGPEDFVFSPARWVAQQIAEKAAKRKTKRWPSHMARNARVRKPKPNRKPGERYEVHSVTTAISRGCRRAFPVPKESTPEEAKAWRAANWWHVHQLRHTFATAARRILGTEAASSALGHAGLKVTEVYAERDEALAAKVAALLG